MPTAAPLRIVQITDLHLKTTPGSRLWGVDVDAGLNAVLARIQERHPQPDGLLVTGDLVGDEPDAYSRVRELLEPLGVPAYCLPGNHDFPARMAQTLRRGWVRWQRSLIAGGWQIILLDSSVPGTPDGHLAYGELAFLDTALRMHPELPALVCLHHNPTPTADALAGHHDGQQWRGAVCGAGPLSAGAGGSLGPYSRRIFRPARQRPVTGNASHLYAVQAQYPGTTTR